MDAATLRVLSHMIALPRLERITAKAIVVCHSEPGVPVGLGVQTSQAPHAALLTS